jgi:hypothetical protein
MAKLGSFFRRLFTPITSDDPNPSSLSSTLESQKSDVPIIPPLPPSISLAARPTTISTQSCTISPNVVTKPIILNADKIHETSKSNYLSSDINKTNIRRLSAPLLIQTSARPHPQYPSTIVNEITEEALLSSLQRSSFSSSITTTTAHPNHSVHSLVANSGGGGSGGSSSGCLLSRPEIRSASFNLSTSPSTISNNLVNNISSTSGRWRKVSFSTLASIFLHIQLLLI